MAEVVSISKPRFKGIPVFLNGQDYLVPSLSLNQFEEHYEALTAAVPEEDTFAAQVARLLPVMVLALQRNYPELTIEQLRDWIDLATFKELFLAVQGASGLKALKPGE